MDVESLRAELETHLANNPDEHAPHGFRDRFNTLAEQYQAAEGDAPKTVLEAGLQQIRNEAEIAVKCAACDEAPADPAPAPRADPAPAPPEAVEAPAEAAPEEPADPPSSGSAMGYVLLLVATVVVLAAAYYFFRR